MPAVRRGPSAVLGAAGTLGGAGATGAGSALKWIMVRVAALLAIAAVLVTAVGLLLQRANDGSVAAWARSAGHDAAWLGHSWVDGGRRPADVRQLTSRIRASGVGDVYVDVGRFDGAGRLSPAAYSHAAGFLRSFHEALPRVRVSAWLGGDTGGGHIDLGDSVTRGHIVAAAAAVLGAGFRGIHYDLEPVTSGDAGLLALLKATRALGHGALSVAAPKLDPLPGLHVPAGFIPGGAVFWTTGYLSQVAKLVSQVDVVGYGTGMPLRSWYGGYVEHETGLALRAVPRGTALVMALPAYDDPTLSHQGGAETVAAAIHGIRVAVTRAGQDQRRAGGADGLSEPRRFGVGLFADSGAIQQSWASYLRGWVRPG
jgi:hypothetical protein